MGENYQHLLVRMEECEGCDISQGLWCFNWALKRWEVNKYRQGGKKHRPRESKIQDTSDN